MPMSLRPQWIRVKVLLHCLFIYTYLPFWVVVMGLCLRLLPGLYPWTSLGDFVPHPTSNSPYCNKLWHVNCEMFRQYKVYADIRGGSLEREGVKWECGCWKWRFSIHSFTVIRTFYIYGHTTAFTWYDCQWPWPYFKVIRLFHIKFLVNGVWYGESYCRLPNGNHTVHELSISATFDNLEGHLKVVSVQLSRRAISKQQLNFLFWYNTRVWRTERHRHISSRPSSSCCCWLGSSSRALLGSSCIFLLGAFFLDDFSNLLGSFFCYFVIFFTIIGQTDKRAATLIPASFWGGAMRKIVEQSYAALQYATFIFNCDTRHTSMSAYIQFQWWPY